MILCKNVASVVSLKFVHAVVLDSANIRVDYFCMRFIFHVPFCVYLFAQGLHVKQVGMQALPQKLRNKKEI